MSVVNRLIVDVKQCTLYLRQTQEWPVLIPVSERHTASSEPLDPNNKTSIPVQLEIGCGVLSVQEGRNPLDLVR